MMDMKFKIVDTLERGLAYAESCFETWRVVAGEVFAMQAHEQRLLRGAEEFGWSLDALAVHDCFVRVSREAANMGADVLVRLTLTAGEAAWGLQPKKQPNLQVYVQYVPALKERPPLHLRAVSWPFALQEKTAKFAADYAYSLRAAQRWQHELQTGEQALICAQGQVMSTMTANVCLHRQGQWYTPDGLGVLRGVVRDFLLQHGVLVAQACPQAWLHDCDAMVCLNSGVWMQAVAALDGRSLTVSAPIEALRQVLGQEKGVLL